MIRYEDSYTACCIQHGQILMHCFEHFLLYYGKLLIFWCRYQGEDPTKGTVEYLSRNDAIRADLIESAYEAVYIGVDYKEVLGPKRGRKSVRIESKERFTHGLYLLDLYHMPHGCGAWPALLVYPYIYRSAF